MARLAACVKSCGKQSRPVTSRSSSSQVPAMSPRIKNANNLRLPQRPQPSPHTDCRPHRPRYVCSVLPNSLKFFYDDMMPDDSVGVEDVSLPEVAMQPNVKRSAAATHGGGSTPSLETMNAQVNTTGGQIGGRGVKGGRQVGRGVSLFV